MTNAGYMVYFLSVLLGFSTINMFAFAFLSLFCSCWLILVLMSCIYRKYVLRPSLRYINVCEIVLGWLLLFLVAQLCDLVTTLAVGGVD